MVYPVADGVKGLTDLVKEQRFDLLCPWGREPKYRATNDEHGGRDGRHASGITDVHRLSERITQP